MKKNRFLNGGFVLLTILLLTGTLASCGGGGGGGGAAGPPEITSWNVKANVYQVYGSNTFAGVSGTTTYWGLNQSDWVYLGEGTATGTFATTGSYQYFLITWSRTPTFYFDSIHDDVRRADVFPLSAYVTNIENYPIANPAGVTNIWQNDGNYAVTLGQGAILFQYTNSISGGIGSMTITVTTTAPH